MNPSYSKQQDAFSKAPPTYEASTYTYEVGSLDNGLPEAPRVRDLFWAILWIVNLLGYIALCVYGWMQYSTRHDMMMRGELEQGTVWTTELLTQLSIGAGITTIAVVLAAVLYLWFASRFPKQLIVTTIVLKIISYLAAAGALAYIAYKSPHSSYLPVLGPALGVLFMVVLYFWWRKRIPFAAVVLSTCANVVRTYPGTAISSFFSLFLLMLWMAIWGFGLVMTSQWATGGLGYALYVYCLFSLYWTQQVIRNIFHVTVSGVAATWYFLGGNVAAVPKNPTLGAFKRATTTSLGSICLGSLLVALLQLMRSLLQSMKSKRNACLICMIDCLLGCIERLIEYFNKYAFTQVAIYGKSYCEAAKQTFSLLRSHGIMAVINDCIVSSVLSMGIILGGVVGGIVGALSGYFLAHSGFHYGWLIVGIYGLLCGFVVMSQVMLVLDSCICTIFVAYAMDPSALQRNDPTLAAEFESSMSLI